MNKKLCAFLVVLAVAVTILASTVDVEANPQFPADVPHGINHVWVYPNGIHWTQAADHYDCLEDVLSLGLIHVSRDGSPPPWEQQRNQVTQPAQQFQPIAPTYTSIQTEPARVLSLTIGSTAFTSNGIPLHSDAPPFIDNNYHRTMVPLRLIAEGLGAYVNWDGYNRNVLISQRYTQLVLHVDTPLPDGMGMPAIVNDRTFVSVRYVSQMLGADVSWDDSTQTVTIITHPVETMVAVTPTTEFIWVEYEEVVDFYDDFFDDFSDDFLPVLTFREG